MPSVFKRQGCLWVSPTAIVNRGGDRQPGQRPGRKVASDHRTLSYENQPRSQST